MSTLIFDLEATGLLRQGSKVHCLVIQDAETGEQNSYDDSFDFTGPLDEGYKRLQQAEFLVAHNGIGYDIPLLAEHGIQLNATCLDTLVLSKLFYPHMADLDFQRQPEGLPKRLYGRHSLEAWGHRLRFNKGDFGQQDDAWEKYTVEMLDYAQQDVRLTGKLWELMQRRISEYQ